MNALVTEVQKSKDESTSEQEGESESTSRDTQL
jgi:hypothetical protein